MADNPPVVGVISPNGGESVLVSATFKLLWTATHDNAVISVDLCVSRDNGATYQPIAPGIPNTGTFHREAPRPGTNSMPTRRR